MTRKILLIVSAIVLVCSPLYPQATRGVITGRVMDTSGAVVPGANITATETRTNVISRTTSTVTGNYTLPSLPIGTYDLRVEVPGFRPFVLQNIALAAGATIRADATLVVGARTDQVTVTAQAVQLQTESSAVVASVSSKMVDELPLLVGGAPRSIFDLASVTPEVAVNPANRESGMVVGGGQRGTVGATLDGISVIGTGETHVTWADMNVPSVEGIAEFNVETHGFKAEYGRASGGKMTFVSKSGTNELHFTAYEFLRNNATDARRFFDPVRAIYKQNSFGFAGGGPVYIPKLYDGRNRTFFFGTMEWFRNRVGPPTTYYSVPTPEMYQGDFSNWVDASGKKAIIYDPATTRLTADGKTYTRDPFLNNTIPLNRFSNYAKSVLKYVGTTAYPTLAGTPGTSAYVRNNFINPTGTQQDPYDKWSIKGDHNFNSSNRVSFLFNKSVHNGPDAGPSGMPGLPGVLTNYRHQWQWSKTYRGTYTKVFAPTIVLSTYAGGQNFKDFKRAVGADESDWCRGKGICMKNAWDSNVAFPYLQFADYQQWGMQSQDGAENTTYSGGGDLSWVKGNHSFKTGYQYERLHYNGWGRQGMSGWTNYQRLSTSIPLNNNLSTGGGNSFASFLLGEVNNGRTESDRFISQQWISHSMYVQDDWKIGRKLTLNLGMRYEFTLPPVHQLDQQTDFRPDKANPSAGGLLGALAFAGSGEGRENTSRLSDGWYGGIGPRFGFAYSPNSKTVIRGGAARSFGIVRTFGGTNHFDGHIIIFTPATLDQDITPAFKADEGFPYYPKPPIIDPSFSNGNYTSWFMNNVTRLPENYDFSLSIQRQLTSTLALETAYNATMGVHLAGGQMNIGQLPFSYIQKYGATLLNSSCTSAAAVAAGIKMPYAYADMVKQFGGVPSVAQCLRPFPQYRGIETKESDRTGHSTYHSFLLSVNQRLSSGLTLTGSYVLAKSITNTDFVTYQQQGLDQDNPGLEKSLSGNDRTHLIKLNYVWDLPFGKGQKFLKSGPLAVILGGWRLAGIHNYQSGLPIQLCNSVTYPIFNTSPDTRNGSRCSPAQVPGYEGWLTSFDHSPDWMGADRYFQPKSFFGTQPTTAFGNAPRFNGKARMAWDLNENFSLGKSFYMTESLRLDFRAEAFNIFNRVKFSSGSTNVDSATFGQVRSTENEPRRMQFALKLIF